MGNDFKVVTIKTTSGKYNVKMQIGCSFENNGCIYRMNNDGKLSAFDKQTKTWSAKSEITMRDYQFDVFKAVANNSREKINGKLSGKDEIILSKEDIRVANEDLYENNALKQDLSTFFNKNVPNPYNVTTAQRYKDFNGFSAYATNGNKETSANLTFKYGSAKDAEKLSNIVNASSSHTSATNHASASDSSTQTQPTKPKTQKTSVSSKNTKVQEQHKQTVPYKSTQTPQNTSEYLNNNGTRFIDPWFSSKTFNAKLTSISNAAQTSKSDKTAATTKTTSTSKVDAPKFYKSKLKALAKSMQISDAQLNTYIKDTAKKTGYSEYFISHVLSNESYEPVVRDTNDGTITGGFGHTRYRDKSLKLGQEVSPQKAFDWLAKDIKFYEKKVKSLNVDSDSKETFGDYWSKMPMSLREAAIDVGFNRDAGKLGNSEEYNRLRANIKELKTGKDNLPACAVSLRQDFSQYSLKQRVNHKHTVGLMKRNCYRFLLAIKDYSSEYKAAAKRRFDGQSGGESYFTNTIKLLKAKGLTADIELLQQAWNNI